MTDAKAQMLIACSAEQAFDAFVNPDTLARFWLSHASAPLAPGASATWRFMVPGAEETVKVTAFSPPGHLAFDWSQGIRVALTFDAHPASGGTVVRVVAAGFSNAEEAVDATEGFSIVLCDLKTLLESGTSAGLVRSKALLIGSCG